MRDQDRPRDASELLARVRKLIEGAKSWSEWPDECDIRHILTDVEKHLDVERHLAAQTTPTILTVARILRKARACDTPPSTDDDTVPCPFCYWGPDDDGKPHEETGCFWFAERIIEAVKSTDATE